MASTTQQAQRTQSSYATGRAISSGGSSRDILRSNSAKLTTHISNVLARALTELYDKNFIPQTVKDDLLSTMGFSNYHKASQLVSVVQSQLSCHSDPDKYLIDFCSVLKNLDSQELTDCANKILVELGYEEPDCGPVLSTTSTPVIEQPSITSKEESTPKPIEGISKELNLKYKNKGEIPKLDYKSYSDDLVADVNVILMTATETEYCAVMSFAKNVISTSTRPSDSEAPIVLLLGDYGKMKVAIVESKQGGDSARDQLECVQKVVKAQYVISVGVCFGMNEKKTNPGDIIVATKVEDISKGRDGAIEEETYATSVQYKSGPNLLQLFEKHNWTITDVHFGTIVSKPRLIANTQEKEKIKSQFKDALAGEMEGFGIMKVAEKGKFEAIVVKAIADWGNDEKGSCKGQKEPSACAAAQFVQSQLSEDLAFDLLKK